MNAITERTSKWQFTEKLHLDKKLIEELKRNLSSPRLTLKISWYDDCDINKIYSYTRYIYTRETDIEDNIDKEVEHILNKIQSIDIMVFVGFYYYDLQNKLKQIILLNYKVPTDDYRFDKNLRKWMYDKSLEEIIKEL